MTTAYYGMIEQIHVMLVDSDQEFVDEMVHLLMSCNYKGDITKHRF